MKVDFIKERETKGAVLYKEVNFAGQIIESMYDSNIGNVYIRKSSPLIQQQGRIPDKITITVEAR